jgi:ABC-type nickel/cobalt efflux system permease component RcnA
MDSLLSILSIIAILVTVFLFIKGAIQTFQRCWWLALLSLALVVTIPLWAVWAMVESILATPNGATDFMDLLAKNGD